MHQANRQVILASDRPPNQLTSLNDNIRTRLEWGLSTDVKVPDESTRLQILQRKQQQLQGLNMDDIMLMYVSRALHTNVRELEGFLKRIHAYVTLSHQALSLALVKAVVKEILPHGASEPVVDMTTPIAATPAAAVANGHHATAQPETEMPVAAVPPPSAVPSAPVELPVPAPMPPPPVPTEFDSISLMEDSSPVPPTRPVPAAPPAFAPDNVNFEILLQGRDNPDTASTVGIPSTPAFFDLGMPSQEQAAVVNLSSPAPASPPAPDLQVFMPGSGSSISPAAPPPPPPAPEVVSEPLPEDEEAMLGHKDISAVFFYPEGATESLETVHRKFQDVIKKHKLKFRLRRVHSEPYAYKGKINYSSFVDVCKTNKVPVAIVIGPPPSGGGGPQQDFYDLLTVTLDVQGVSLQLVNWSEINKDYRYLNLALDIALVRSR
jgi:hypothetical protein